MEGMVFGFKDLANWLKEENNLITEGEWEPKNYF